MQVSPTGEGIPARGSDALETEPELDELSPERKAFRRFVALTRQKRSLENQLDEVKTQMDSLALQLRDYLSSGGYERVRIDGMTVYCRRELWARKYDWASTDEVCRQLKAGGMGHFVKEGYNAQTLSKHIRELEDQHASEIASGDLENVTALLPAALTRVLNIEPSYKVIAVEVG